MHSEILAGLAPSLLDVLSARGFVLVRQDLESRFDNAYVETSSPGMRLRIARDRGDVTLLVGPTENADWHKLELVLQFLAGSADSLEAKPVDEVAEQFNARFNEVEDLLRDPGGWSRFLDFERHETNQTLRDCSTIR